MMIGPEPMSRIFFRSARRGMMRLIPPCGCGAQDTSAAGERIARRARVRGGLHGAGLGYLIKTGRHTKRRCAASVEFRPRGPILPFYPKGLIWAFKTIR